LRHAHARRPAIHVTFEARTPHDNERPARIRGRVAATVAARAARRGSMRLLLDHRAARTGGEEGDGHKRLRLSRTNLSCFRSVLELDAIASRSLQNKLVLRGDAATTRRMRRFAAPLICVNTPHAR